MAKDSLTGSRIRERRIARGMRQGDLARDCGISASYLNLIEHNRRRIGGKLLLMLADKLAVDPVVLTEGAGAALVAALREAASDTAGSGVELDRIDEFAGRFPGWAKLLADSQNRITALERAVQALTDRMTHDPHLAASLHEMLTTVTAIRSAASILAEPGEVDPGWQKRFHRNIYEDSGRLAEASRGLVTYLEAASEGEAATVAGAPQEEVDGVLAGLDHRVPQLETGEGTPESLLPLLGKGVSAPARALLMAYLTRYASDAQALPLTRLAPEVARLGPDPAALSGVLAAEPALVMRRLAAMPVQVLPMPVGLAICDASGVLSYRKPLADFPMPRFGAACPLWPLYRALNRPYVILSLPLVQPGRSDVGVWADAIASPAAGVTVNRDPLYNAHMLIRPVPAHVEPTPNPSPVGLTCRICPRQSCEGRREPSILSAAV